MIEWDHGGLTDIDNMKPMCDFHHHAHHDNNTWRYDPSDDPPDGRARPAPPPAFRQRLTQQWRLTQQRRDDSDGE